MKNKNNNAEIVARILDLVEKNGKMDKDVVIAANLSRTALSEWRSGRAYPGVNAIIKLADYFHVSTDYILNGKDFEPTETTGLDPEWRNIMKKISGMSEEDRNKITAYIKGIIEGYSLK